MNLAKSILLFIVAAFAEIGGAWLIWQGVREHRGLLWIGAGVIALGLYGFVATLQPDANFGRILAAYGGIFVAGSLAWGMVVDKFRPDRWDIIGAIICLVGVAVIMYAPRAAAWPHPRQRLRRRTTDTGTCTLTSRVRLGSTELVGRGRPTGEAKVFPGGVGDQCR